ncbi:hypothetical protein IM538_18505 [Cytobacillus suaedae]|nr:hypothetical protein IM538_18505 [Cytobacillus suaedae]
MNTVFPESNVEVKEAAASILKPLHYEEAFGNEIEVDRYFNNLLERIRPEELNVKKKGIRDLKSFVESVGDYGILNDLLPGRLKFGDLDGILEKNGKFLVLEHKKDDGVDVPKGQKILFERLAKTNLFTVIVIFGDIFNPTALQIYYPTSYQAIVEKKCATLKELKRTIEWWLKKEAL